MKPPFPEQPEPDLHDLLYKTDQRPFVEPTELKAYQRLKKTPLFDAAEGWWVDRCEVDSAGNLTHESEDLCWSSTAQLIACFLESHWQSPAETNERFEKIYNKFNNGERWLETMSYGPVREFTKNNLCFWELIIESKIFADRSDTQRILLNNFKIFTKRYFRVESDDWRTFGRMDSLDDYFIDGGERAAQPETELLAVLALTYFTPLEASNRYQKIRSRNDLFDQKSLVWQVKDATMPIVVTMVELLDVAVLIRLGEFFQAKKKYEHLKAGSLFLPEQKLWYDDDYGPRNQDYIQVIRPDEQLLSLWIESELEIHQEMSSSDQSLPDVRKF